MLIKEYAYVRKSYNTQVVTEVYRRGELAKVNLIFILNFYRTFSEPCFGLGAVGHSKKPRPTFGPRHLLFKEGKVG